MSFYWLFDPGTHKTCNPSFLGDVCLAKVIGRYFPGGTVLPLVKLFNHRVLELGAGKHSKVGNLTLADNVALKRLRLVNYPKVEA